MPRRACDGERFVDDRRDEHALVVVLEHERVRALHRRAHYCEHAGNVLRAELTVLLLVHAHHLLRAREHARLRGGGPRRFDDGAVRRADRNQHLAQGMRARHPPPPHTRARTARRARRRSGRRWQRRRVPCGARARERRERALRGKCGRRRLAGTRRAWRRRSLRCCRPRAPSSSSDSRSRARWGGMGG